MSDYLWYTTSGNISDEDVAFWSSNGVLLSLTIGAIRAGFNVLATGILQLLDLISVCFMLLLPAYLTSSFSYLRIWLLLDNKFHYVKQVFTASDDFLLKLHFAYISACHGLSMEIDDGMAADENEEEVLQEIVYNANLGMILFWDSNSGFAQLDKYLHSNDTHVVAGALLGIGVVYCGVGKLVQFFGGDGTKTSSEDERFDPFLGKRMCSPYMRHSRFDLTAAELSGVKPSNTHRTIKASTIRREEDGVKDEYQTEDLAIELQVPWDPGTSEL